jgi:hypothetical protein
MVVAMTIAFFLTGWTRSIGFYLTCWMGSHEELYQLLLESLHLGLFRLLAMSMIVVVMMIAFFPNWLDPLDRIISNLLDGFL